MTQMLQAMKHRGPDSSGYALFGEPSDLVVIRFKLADANDPRDFDFKERLDRNRQEVESRLHKIGASVDRVESETEYAYRATVRYDGDMKALADYLEDVPGCEVLSLGHSLEIVKDIGDAQEVSDLYRARRVHGHPRDRARPDGDGVRCGHLRSAPVLGISVLRRRRRAQRAADELLPMEAATRVQRRAVPVGMRLGDHRGVPRREDVRRRFPRGRDAQEPRGPRRRVHVHGGHEGCARCRQGRDGREAARPVRVRRAGRDGVARRSRSGRC